KHRLGVRFVCSQFNNECSAHVLLHYTEALPTLSHSLELPSPLMMVQTCSSVHILLSLSTTGSLQCVRQTDRQTETDRQTDRQTESASWALRLIGRHCEERV